MPESREQEDRHQGKSLALDLGTVRIGLAASDEDGRLAFARSALTRKDLARDLQALARWAAEEAAMEWVVGLPLNMDGSEGPRAKAARRFARRLGQATGLPVILVDERLSTAEAEECLRRAGLDARRARPRIDAEAARVILQRHLDERAGLEGGTR